MGFGFETLIDKSFIMVISIPIFLRFVKIFKRWQALMWLSSVFPDWAHSRRAGRRDLPVSMLRWAYSPGQACLILTRSGAGAPELRSFTRPGHGEGQALALRWGAFFRRPIRDRVRPNYGLL